MFTGTSPVAEEVDLTPSQNEDFVEVLGLLPDLDLVNIKKTLLIFKDYPDRKQRVTTALLENFTADLESETHRDIRQILNEKIDDPTSKGKRFFGLQQTQPCSKQTGSVSKSPSADEAYWDNLHDELTSRGIPVQQISEFNELPQLCDMFPNISQDIVKRVLSQYVSFPNPITPAVEALMNHGKHQLEEAPGSTDNQKKNVLQKSESWKTSSKELHLKNIVKLFVDIDPGWIFRKMSQDWGESAEALVIMMLAEPNSYDRMKTRQGYQLVETRRNTYLQSAFYFTPAKIFKIFRDPFAYFNNPERTVSITYADHARCILLNDFRTVSKEYLHKTYIRHKCLLYHTYKELSRALGQDIEEEHPNILKLQPPRKKFELRPIQIPQEHIIPARAYSEPWPQYIDPAFFIELLFVRTETSVYKYQNIRQQQRENDLEKQKIKGLVLPCEKCVTRKCLFEDMITCDNGHQFCKTCIAEITENNINQGKVKLKCLQDNCDYLYTFECMSEIISASAFNKFIHLQKCKNDTNTNNDSLANVERCPFCDFTMLLQPEVATPMIACLNFECLRISCRKCQEENHLPLKCDEVEKGTNIDWNNIKRKTYAEMNRTCVRCTQKLKKRDNMNKLQCKCGTYICFLCKVNFTSEQEALSHFFDDLDTIPIALKLNRMDANGKKVCPLRSTIHEAEQEEMRNVANDFRVRYMNKYPDLKYLQRICMLKMVEKMKRNGREDEPIKYSTRGTQVDNTDFYTNFNSS